MFKNCQRKLVIVRLFFSESEKNIFGLCQVAKKISWKLYNEILYTTSQGKHATIIIRKKKGRRSLKWIYFSSSVLVTQWTIFQFKICAFETLKKKMICFNTHKKENTDTAISLKLRYRNAPDKDTQAIWSWCPVAQQRQTAVGHLGPNPVQKDLSRARYRAVK